MGVQEPLHQMFDYVAVEGMKSLFNAKIGVFSVLHCRIKDSLMVKSILKDG